MRSSLLRKRAVEDIPEGEMYNLSLISKKMQAPILDWDDQQIMAQHEVGGILVPTEATLCISKNDLGAEGAFLAQYITDEGYMKYIIIPIGAFSGVAQDMNKVQKLQNMIDDALEGV